MSYFNDKKQKKIRYYNFLLLPILLITINSVNATQIGIIENRTNHNIFIKNEDTEDNIRDRNRKGSFYYLTETNSLIKAVVNQKWFSLGPMQRFQFEDDSGTVPWQSTQGEKYIWITTTNDTMQGLPTYIGTGSGAGAGETNETFQGKQGVGLKIREENGKLATYAFRGQFKQNCQVEWAWGRTNSALELNCGDKYFSINQQSQIWKDQLPGNKTFEYKVIVGPNDDQFAIIPMEGKISNNQIPEISGFLK